MSDHYTFFKKISRKDSGPALELLNANPHWGEDGQSLLESVKQSKPVLVRRILDLGGDANVRSLPTPGAWRIPLGRAVEACKDGGWTPEQRQIAEWLLEAGADPGARSCHGMLPVIVLAAGAGNRDAVDWLLGQDVEIDLETACALGDVERVRSEVAADPGVAARGRPSGRAHFFNVTLPITGAAKSGLGRNDPAMAKRLGDIARILIDAGSPVGPWKHDSHVLPSPTEDAAFSGNAAVLAVLLQRGASAQDVLESALHHGNPAVLEVMDGYNLDLGGTIATEAKWGRLSNCLWLAERGADPNQRGNEGLGALHYAARRGAKPEWFASMAGHGADLHKRDAAGRSPLDIAEAKNKKRLMKWLAAQLDSPS